VFLVQLQGPSLGAFALRPPCSGPLQESQSFGHFIDDSPSPSIGFSPSPYLQPVGSPLRRLGSVPSQAGRRLDFRLSAADRGAFARPLQVAEQPEPALSAVVPTILTRPSQLVAQVEPPVAVVDPSFLAVPVEFGRLAEQENSPLQAAIWEAPRPELGIQGKGL
jgi:hypothetical protein